MSLLYVPRAFQQRGSVSVKGGPVSGSSIAVPGSIAWTNSSAGSVEALPSARSLTTPRSSLLTSTGKGYPLRSSSPQISWRQSAARAESPQLSLASARKAQSPDREAPTKNPFPYSGSGHTSKPQPHDRATAGKRQQSPTALMFARLTNPPGSPIRSLDVTRKTTAMDSSVKSLTRMPSTLGSSVKSMDVTRIPSTLGSSVKSLDVTQMTSTLGSLGRSSPQPLARSVFQPQVSRATSPPSPAMQQVSSPVVRASGSSTKTWQFRLPEQTPLSPAGAETFTFSLAARAREESIRKDLASAEIKKGRGFAFGAKCDNDNAANDPVDNASTRDVSGTPEITANQTFPDAAGAAAAHAVPTPRNEIVQSMQSLSEQIMNQVVEIEGNLLPASSPLPDDTLPVLSDPLGWASHVQQQAESEGNLR